MMILACVASASSVMAQAKKANAKNAAANAPVTAPAVTNAPAPAQAPIAAASADSGMRLGIWGGYNVANSDSFSSIDKSVTEADSNFTARKTSTVTKGGIAAGADIWLGNDFQYGLGIAYLQVYKLAWANTEGAAKANIDANIAYLPVHLQALYEVSGFKIGAGAGLSLGFGETTSVLSGFGVGTDGTTTTKVKGSALSAGVIVAYGVNFGNVTADIGVRYYAIFEDKIVQNIVPNITLGYRF